jgi:uroporphyrin-III C-methyltransferase/precorrin-2 dehydrogenase/sirohydrochlorin ferrochelatase
MGLARVSQIAAKFVEHGAPETLPAALIAQGTLENQRVITGTLATIAEAATRARLHSPTLLVVGEVVSLHDSLAWFNPAAQLEVSQSA